MDTLKTTSDTRCFDGAELYTPDNKDTEKELKIARKQAADYALAFDWMARLTHSGSEKEAIESILKLFEMLFIPDVLCYVSIKDGEPGQVYALSVLPENEETIKCRSGLFKGKHAWTTSMEGFRVKIHFNGTDFGILEVDNVGFPEHKEHYLNLTLSITDVCGLAIENARKHEVIKETERRLRQEKMKLEKALAEVKTLSGLLPICMHCKQIRDDEGYWNQIESYIEKHSDAQFSHSICRECAEHYYPDMDLYDDE